MTGTVIPTDGFSDRRRAARNLDALQQMFITSGSHVQPDEFFSAVSSRLLSSPDPDMALTNLVRFSESSLGKASLFNDLVHYPPLLDVLVGVCGHSQYFADILVRDPEIFRWLTSTDVLNRPLSRLQLDDELQRVECMFQRKERTLDALRRIFRREILRIGARDILALADLRTVTQELSDLADALVGSCCRIASTEMIERHGAEPESRYALIGLGKLGGQELNFSSDIDVIFVYECEGELQCEPAITYHEYYNKFVERIINNLSQNTHEGHLFRVDTRLRPEGGAGPLARSLGSYLFYYESRGELWERQMLLKARVVAGDLDFGKEFINQLGPFVFPRTLFRNPIEEIGRIKARIEAVVGDEENVKLRAGGIRDIEFIVQTLQLTNGGKNKAIRTGNTLEAVEKLTAEGLLSTDEGSVLREAYVFLRALEHRLQFMLNTQTHTISPDERVQHSLARRLGLKGARELKDAVTGHHQAVRTIFDNVMSVRNVEESKIDVEALVDGNISEERAGAILKRCGFKDIRRAMRNISQLASGSTLTGARQLDARARDAFRGVAASVFDAVSRTPVPDFTFDNLAAVLSAQKLPEQSYRQLGNEGYRRFLVQICATGYRFVREFAQNPLVLETLAGNIESLHHPSTAERIPVQRLAGEKLRQEVRAGVRYILGLSNLEESFAELTAIADREVSAALEAERKSRKAKPPPFAIFALGKYGTGEITFDADLDVIFIGAPARKSDLEKLESLATGLVNRLSSFSDGKVLYEVDARLRPEGKNAPLVVTEGAYLKYLQNRASLWERQSLTRLRYICGDEALGRSIGSNVMQFVYHAPLPAGWVDQIAIMRKKIETRSMTRSAQFHDIKLGPGGMVDVEFLAQMLQLRHGTERVELRAKGTVAVLQEGGKIIASDDELATLIDSYRHFRRVETMMRIVLLEKGTVLPEGAKLDLLARCMGYDSGQSLAETTASMMKEVRSTFHRMTKQLAAQ
jgi:glutamate-ammonia-ligase adenylyltransferase